MAKRPKAIKPTKYKAFHAHGCDQCSRRYTDTCTTPSVNGRCQTCRHGRSPLECDLRPLWDRDHDPRACCREVSKLIITAAEMERYGLAGPGPWFKCKTCSRTHPYDPRINP